MANGSDGVEMMDISTDSESSVDAYLTNEINKLKFKNRYSAKSWLLTAMTLYPNNFDIHFEAYLMEKKENNFEEAAKYFSYIMLTFPNRSKIFWEEINLVIEALRTKEIEITSIQEFYVKMFQYTDKEVQHNLVLLTISNTEDSFDQCKLLLLTLKRYPQSVHTHSGRLLEMIINGMKDNPNEYQRIFMDEVLPLLYHKSPEISTSIVCRSFAVFCEYYLRQIIDEDKYEANEIWRNIFQILMTCGRLMHWQQFLPFNKNWSHSIYWEKLIEIVSHNKRDKTQVIYYATTLFIYALFCYIRNCNIRQDEQHLCHVLVEGFTDWPLENRNEIKGNEPPQISLTTPTSHGLSRAFVHAAQCWQLLNSDQFQREFSSLLVTLPLSPWISRFLFDLAIYFGHKDEARTLMKDMTVTNALVKDLLHLSHNQLQGLLTLDGFHCILNIFRELPTPVGQLLDHLTLKISRHLIFLPLTQKAIVQYCVRCLIRLLTARLYESNCNDDVLGDLIILLQLEYPRETDNIEQIFAIIAKRRSFVFRNFTQYLITIDFIEEFMFLWNTYSDMNFDFAPSANTLAGATALRRTRGSEKGVREDFRSIIKQQILRCNENVFNLLVNFITQEQMHLTHMVCDVDYKAHRV